MSEQLLRVVAVVPSLNPDEKLKTVVSGLLEKGFFKILLVDDGSAETHKHRFQECVALDERVELLVHPVNRGKGAAMKTAFEYILKNFPKCEGAVTVDGDAQHDPEDCRRCAEKMIAKDCVVLGVRDFSGENVPAKSRMGNRITSLVFRLFCGMKLSDTQTGLRAFPIDILSQMVKTKGDRYEYETQMLLDFKSLKIPYTEEKIRTVYIEENQTSHFRVIKDSFRIYKMIFAHFFKYLATSFASYILEFSIVSALTVLINNTTGWEPLTVTTVTYLCARAVSSVFNFFMNQKVVFQAKCSMKQSLWKYYTLCIPLAALGLAFNLAGVGGAVWLDFLPPAVEDYVNLIIHPLVQILMFLFTFTVQREWVYKTDNKYKFKRREQKKKNNKK
ncbi:MAG: glycosyltransferase [Clostridia bacterium]|nr:glycosyltransferase [Clostridia bacterium]